METVSLKPWEEYAGRLINVRRKGDGGYLYFDDGTILTVPGKLVDVFKSKVGWRIAVLRTDLSNKPYLWRKKDESN